MGTQERQFLCAQRRLMALVEKSGNAESLNDPHYAHRLLTAEVLFDVQRDQLAQHYRRSRRTATAQGVA